MLKQVIFISFALLLNSSPSWADHQFNIPRWYVGFSQSSGGDDIAKLDVLVDDINSSQVLETRSLSAGDGYQFTLGNAIRIGHSPFSARLTIGWHSDKLTATTGKAQFTRIPVELLGFYAFRNHRIGGGVVGHFNVELDIEDAAGPIVNFKPAPGVALEYGYALGGLGYLSKYWAGIRFVSIDYEVDLVDGDKHNGRSLEFDGSHAALFLALAW